MLHSSNCVTEIQIEKQMLLEIELMPSTVREEEKQHELFLSIWNWEQN